MYVPTVSIGLPVYNGEKYLRLALDCIVQQEFADFELIISDNASTDGTQEICQEYAARDKRLSVIFANESNTGAAANFNRVFELAQAEFFKWATHDDEFHFSLIRCCLETFENSPRYSFRSFPVPSSSMRPVELRNCRLTRSILQLVVRF